MKKHTQNKALIILVSLLSLLLISLSSNAENNLSEKDKNILEQSGVGLYPGLQYVNSTFNGLVGVRFATTEGVEKVRQWYREAFPEWALNDDYGAWILYNGKPGGPAEYMYKNQVMVAENENLQEWFGMPAGMKTEVVIALPEITN